MKGELIKHKYFILQTLGQNSFSETFFARDQRWFIHRRYIIKKFRPILGNFQVAAIQRSFYQEASVLKRLSGRNHQIPRLYEYFMDGEDFFLVREWIDGLTLEQKVQQQGRLASAEVEQILKSILACLEYIHSFGIVYRQLTPSSIILRPSSTGYLPIPIYFGGVKEFQVVINQSNQRNLPLAHQPQYLPPEQQEGNSVYASDLYSLGLTTIYLLTGKTPAELPCDPQTKRLLWHQEMPDLKIHLARVIDRAISPDVQRRFATAAEMKASLNSSPINIAMPEVAQTYPAAKSHLVSDLKIIAPLLFSGLSMMVIAFMFMNPGSFQFSRSSIGQLVNHSEVDEITSESVSLSDVQPSTAVEIPALSLGISQKQLTNLLGEPTNDAQGNKQTSNLLLYRDFIPNKIDLAYLTDDQTNKVHQVEISFADSVELVTIYQAVQQLLRADYSADIEQYLNHVYFNTSDRIDFQLGTLAGVVRRDAGQKINFRIGK
ncbi:MAG: serine/threonine-protein kinase [Cyanobacteria bacterium P01_E01_bin.35]